MHTYIQKIKEIALPNKYTKYYCSIIEKALLRPQDRKILKEIYGYVESHHILPKCFELGGHKDKENLVFLTAKEHFIVHLCATKMFISNFKNKMVFAFRQLRSSNKYQESRYMNSRLYQKIKPVFKEYARLYKLEEVKYVHESNQDLQKELQEQGWSIKMTEEYKVGRVGMMKGRKHSEEYKTKMSEIRKGKPNLKLRGQKKTDESIRKAKETRIKSKLENPEKFEKIAKDGRERMIKMHKMGVFEGKNGMLGKEHTDETKKIIGDGAVQRWEELAKDPTTYKETIEKMSTAQKERWKDPFLKERSSIFNSKASYKHGITPQEYYDQKLKPLLYLGFLPTSIVRYNLVDMCACSIKRLIWEFGDEKDKEQFELNKRKSAGANKSYIKFLEDQYNKHFKN